MELRKKCLNVTSKVTITGWVRDHKKLHNLDYEHSGHTGFASEKDLNKKADLLVVQEIAAQNLEAAKKYADEKLANIVAPDYDSFIKQHNSDIHSHEDIRTILANKVDKIEGKGLSTNDLTNELLDKINGLSNYDDSRLLNLIDGKVDKKDGFDLVAEEDIQKLKSLAAITNVDNTLVLNNGTLGVNKIRQDQVEGLPEALANIGNIGGKIDGIQVNGNDLSIDAATKKVNIEFNSSEFTYANNKISLNKIGLDKLVGSEEGEELVLNGGDA